MSIQRLLKWDLSLGRWRFGVTDLGATSSNAGGYKYSEGRRIEEQRLRTELGPNPAATGSESTNNEIKEGE